MFDYSNLLATGQKPDTSGNKEEKKPKSDEYGLLDEKDEDQAIADYSTIIATGETE